MLGGIDYEPTLDQEGGFKPPFLYYDDKICLNICLDKGVNGD